MAYPLPPRDSFDRMMDEIAAARSPGEFALLRAEVAERFAEHPLRAKLDALIDDMLAIVTRAPSRRRGDTP